MPKPPTTSPKGPKTKGPQGGETSNHITKGSKNQGSTRGGGEPDAQTQEEGNPNDMSHLQRTCSGQHSHAVT